MDEIAQGHGSAGAGDRDEGKDEEGDGHISAVTGMVKLVGISIYTGLK
jgi:hypothetical protein